MSKIDFSFMTWFKARKKKVIIIISVFLVIICAFLYSYVNSHDEITDRTLPAELYSDQIKQTYRYDGKYYAIFQRSSLNIYIKSSPSEAGILFANQDDRDWKYYAQITEKSDSKNNPYFLDYQSGNLYLLIVDTNGAGSGEGIAKLLKQDTKSSIWTTLSCFYYSDNFIWLKNEETLEEATNKYVNSKVGDNYLFNPLTADYEITYYNQNTEQSELVKQEHCQDFKISNSL